MDCVFCSLILNKKILYLLAHNLNHDATVVKIVHKLPGCGIKAELLFVIEVWVSSQAYLLCLDILNEIAS